MYYDHITEQEVKTFQRKEGMIKVGKCPLCKNQMKSKKAKSLPCGHTFHEECIRGRFFHKKNCPVCKKFFSDDAIECGQPGVRSSERGARIDQRPNPGQKGQPAFDQLGGDEFWDNMLGLGDENHHQSGSNQSLESNQTEEFDEMHGAIRSPTSQLSSEQLGSELDCGHQLDRQSGEFESDRRPSCFSGLLTCRM